MARHNVFVYGTLKRGFHNAPAMVGAEFLGSGTTAVRLPLVADEYFIPYLLDLEGEGEHVKGEVYRVDDAVFAKLDRLENYPAYYDRRQLQVVGPELAAAEARGAEEATGLCCWVYIRKEATAEQLAMTPMGEYALDEHRAKYVPRDKRDASHISKCTGPQLDEG